MAKKTAFDDLFSDDFGKLGLQRLEELNAMALTLKENLKASAQTLSAKVRGASPSTASGAKEIENTKKEVEDLKKQSEALAKIQEKLNKATSDAAKEQAQYNLELKRQNQLNRENAILESEKSTQYEKNVVLLNRLSKQIMALGGTDKAPKELADEFNRLFGEVKNAEESVKRFQRNVGNYASATAELKALTKQLIDLELAGQRDSAAFREMQKRAAELSDTISDTKAEIKNMASDTKTIDGLVGSVNLLANGFQVFEGVMALTGETSEEWKETMVKLQAIMAITSGLQEIQNLLQKESAAMMFLNTVQTKAAAAAQTLYSFATGGATLATKAFRIALLATGIGAIVVLLGTLAGAMSDVGDETEGATEAVTDFDEAVRKYAEAVNTAIEKTIEFRKGATGSAEALNRELNLMKARGESAQKIFEKEQQIRKADLFTLQKVHSEKIRLRGIEYMTSIESAKDLENIRNKENEIEAARLEREKDIREAAAKKREEENKKALDEMKKQTELRLQIMQESMKKELLEEEWRFAQAADAAADNQETLTLEEELHLKKMQEIRDRYKEKEKEEKKKDGQEEVKEEKKNNKEKENEEQLSLERRKQFAQQALQYMQQISEETAKAKLDAIDKELSASEERESQLKTLAQQGQLNAQQSIALEEKRQAELESKREKALKRQREQAIILAGIEAFIASARAGSTNPSGDAGNQVNGLISNLEAALNKIKAFEKGGLVDGGEQLVRINEKGEEFVVKHDAVNKYGEQMLYDINEGRFNPLDYVSTPSQSAYSFSEPISTKVVEKLERVEEAIRTKPVPSWSVSEITKGVREDIREGNNLLRKHYERGNKLF